MFFFPAFYMLLRILLSAIRATIFATVFWKERKMRKNQVFYAPAYRRPIVPL